MTERKTPNPNRDNDLPTVLLRIGARADITEFARVVGRWVWIEFPSRPPKDTCSFLLAEGFWFNRKRSAWQHGCGSYTAHARSYDPRTKYGSVGVSEILADSPQALSS